MRNANRVICLNSFIFLISFGSIAAASAHEVSARFGTTCSIAYGKPFISQVVLPPKPTLDTPEAAPPFVPVDVLSSSNKIRSVAINALEPIAPKDTEGLRRGRRLLLKMLAGTNFESASRKFTIEKGNLRLGHDLGGHRSIEFEYEGDYRTGEMILRLSRIVLYKPNGQPIVLQKAPVADDGKTLLAKSLSFTERFAPDADEILIDIKDLDAVALKSLAGENVDLAASLEANKALGAIGALDASRHFLTANDASILDQFISTQQTIEVPVVIEGVLMTELQRWIKRLPHISRQELKLANTDSAINAIKRTARVRGFMNFVKTRLQRQSFNIVFAAGLFYMVDKAELVDVSSLLPGGTKIGQMLHGQRADVDMLIVKELLDNLDVAKSGTPRNEVARSEIESLERKAVEHIRISSQVNDRGEFLNQLKLKMKDQEEKERALGGEVTYKMAELPNMRVPSLPDGKFAYIIGSYPAQKKFALVPIVIAAGDQASAMTIIPVTERKYPQIYQLIRKLIAEPNN